jgi:hypothetical protein
MSYYRNPKSLYRLPLYKSTINKEDQFDIFDFLKKEFFNTDKETFRLIADFYRKNYGESAHEYMLKTYKSWKKGTVNVSSLTFNRIIECVPQFLSPEKRLYILRCEIYNFLEKAKEKLKTDNLKLTKLHHIFETLQKEIINFNESNLKWFIGKNIFPVDQVEHYLCVCKYALNERLIQSYKQSINDLSIISEKFLAFRYNIDSAFFKIDFLNISIDVSKISKNKIPQIPLHSLSLNLDKSFIKFGEKYILEELMKISFYEKEGEVNASLKSKDIDTIFSHFVAITKGKNEVTINSKLQGDGGILIMKLEFTPIKKSIETILISLSKLIAIVVVLTIGTQMVIKFNFNWILPVMALGGFVFIIYILTIIPEEIIKISKSIIQIIRYGKQ